VLLALVAVFAFSSQVNAQNFVFTGKPAEFKDFGYLIRGSAWQFAAGQEKVVFVCWENSDPTNQIERQWIRNQIENTWQKHSAVQFRGWQKCEERNAGIRILFNDEGPHVKKFGKDLNGYKSGMILNNDFNNWSPDCQSMRESCIRSIAAHEFGHALGFAHEQNRPDTPGECRRVHGQGQLAEQMLTKYDPRSIMNYCNSVYNNDGNLSELDIKAVQAVYGRPQ
jgi:hypothetical protein